MKHIGIVAVSAEGAALCYRTICTEGAALVGRHAHPEISMHTFPLADYMKPIYENRWDDVAEMLLRSAECVRRSGADFLICPDNTAHQAIDLIIARSPLYSTAMCSRSGRVANPPARGRGEVEVGSDSCRPASTTPCL